MIETGGMLPHRREPGDENRRQGGRVKEMECSGAKPTLLAPISLRFSEFTEHWRAPTRIPWRFRPFARLGFKEAVGIGLLRTYSIIPMPCIHTTSPSILAIFSVRITFIFEAQVTSRIFKARITHEGH